MKTKFSWQRIVLLLAGLVVAAFAWPQVAHAQPLGIPGIDLRINTSNEPQSVATTLNIILLLTVLSLAPAFLVMLTSFTRIVVVLGFVRNALATQQIPPNQVLIGLALFLTFFTMMPTFQQVYSQAIQPYIANQITQEEAIARGEAPLRQFMFKQTREKDLALFVNMAKMPRPRNQDDIPMSVLIPAFAISELKTAFQMGFLIYIPFLIIDLVVASTLMSMGMFMVPPIMISLPFKILLFVMVDGWYLIVKSLMQSF
ncbi:MAG: flagellar type III secretion system pore protein FliP [Clostridia bacterium]|nr:flagellar type III secretion system pore protein FliP [Clostridia bacterium]